MKKIILISSLLFCQLLLSQSYVDATGADRFSSTRALEDFNSLKGSVESEELMLEDVLGSMYFDEEFQAATVILNDKKVEEKTFLRYNAFKDEIEIGSSVDQKIASNILIKRSNVGAIIGKETYILIAIPGSKNPEGIYVVELFSQNNHKLYLHRYKKFVEEKPAPSGLGGSLPARFEDQTTLYHTSLTSPLPEMVRVSKNGILKLFPEDQVRLKKFISQNKIKFKENQDVLFVFENFKLEE
jgi:hypothetical protein